MVTVADAIHNSQVREHIKTFLYDLWSDVLFFWVWVNGLHWIDTLVIPPPQKEQWKTQSEKSICSKHPFGSLKEGDRSISGFCPLSCETPYRASRSEGSGIVMVAGGSLRIVMVADWVRRKDTSGISPVSSISKEQQNMAYQIYSTCTSTPCTQYKVL